jgi:hypothetical protein
MITGDYLSSFETAAATSANPPAIEKPAETIASGIETLSLPGFETLMATPLLTTNAAAAAIKNAFRMLSNISHPLLSELFDAVHLTSSQGSVNRATHLYFSVPLFFFRII